MLASLVLLALLPTADPAVEADVLVRNVTLHDGAGQPGVVGDLALRGDRIVAVGRFTLANKPRILDGTGLVAAPGFIDLHTHSDDALTQPATRDNLCYLLQGVTTVVTGNCGSGPVDVAKYFGTVEVNGAGSNLIHQATHNSIRRQVMGNANRPPSEEELKRMEELVDKAMKDGAWGLSTGLIYNPGTYSKTDEVVALAKVAAKQGGFYASHIRNEEVGLLAAIAEAITIGREAKLPVHISHIKANGSRMWGKSADAIALIRQARAKGQQVTADQYPYTASSTSLAAMVVPAVFREGSSKEFQARLDDAEQGPRIRQAIEKELADRQNGKSLQVARYAKNRSWQGKDLLTLATQQKRTPLELVLEIERTGGAQMVSFGMNEEDVRLFMKEPFVATASDGSSQTPGDSVPHPRSYGCFARKIGHYCLTEKVIPLEHAIRSCSGVPADILKLPQRGYLKAGCFADVVVFDPKTFRDTATYAKPHQYATGAKWVFVNGHLVIEDGKYNGKLAGRVLRHE